MAPKLVTRHENLSLILQQRSTDEYSPLGWSAQERQFLPDLQGAGARLAKRLGLTAGQYWSGRLGTAAAIRAIDAAAGGGFFNVPAEAAADPAAADAFLGGDQLIVDIQTHYVASHRVDSEGARAVLGFIQAVAPDRWKGLRDMSGFGLANYVRYVFLESETAVAVLTSAPGDAQRSMLTNDEIAATRELVDRLAGSGRLLNHAIVHPNAPGEIETLDLLQARCRPLAWKVYTLHGGDADGRSGWMLDDAEFGRPFLTRSRELGVHTICAHKGLSGLAPAGSPADVGPAAAAFPDVNFLIYHSGYERPGPGSEESWFDPEKPDQGTDRLVKSLRDAGVGPGRNVYAELGSTWYLLIRRPREAAHVLGKLLCAVGEDNVLWGTDSIWYGSPQPLIDAFRAFQIPQEYQDRYGYPALTPAVKAKILGLNAARVYDIDVQKARARFQNDDLAWARSSLPEIRDSTN